MTLTAVTAVLAYVPAVWASTRDGVWIVVAIDTAAWIAIIALAAWRRGPYHVRAATFLVLWLALATSLVALLGPVGAGALWLLATPLLATVLFGGARGLLAVAAVATVSVAFGVALWRFGPIGVDGAPGPSYEGAHWRSRTTGLAWTPPRWTVPSSPTSRRGGTGTARDSAWPSSATSRKDSVDRPR